MRKILKELHAWYWRKLVKKKLYDSVEVFIEDAPKLARILYVSTSKREYQVEWYELKGGRKSAFVPISKVYPYPSIFSNLH